MDKTIIARKLQYYRNRSGMTQESLAEKVGVSDTYIRKLEAGERTPSLAVILALADTLNTTPDHLLLSVACYEKKAESGVVDLLADCTPTEYIILYENLSELKKILRKHASDNFI